MTHRRGDLKERDIANPTHSAHDSLADRTLQVAKRRSDGEHPRSRLRRSARAERERTGNRAAKLQEGDVRRLIETDQPNGRKAGLIDADGVRRTSDHMVRRNHDAPVVEREARAGRI